MKEPPVKSTGILIVDLMTSGFGGKEAHVISLYRELTNLGFRPFLLVLGNSTLHERATGQGIRCATINYHKLPGYYSIVSILLSAKILWLCKRHDLGIIHCNNRFEVKSAKRVNEWVSAKVVFNYHVTSEFKTEVLTGVDAFISPSSEVAELVRERSASLKHGPREIRCIPPLFDAGRILGFRSDQPPAEWFKQTFGIDLKPHPIVSSIGNMVSDLEHKNYPLLFRATAHLIHTESTPVQLVLAGDGPARPYLQQLAQDLLIADHVHFLGSTNDATPGVLYHSDFFVLASSKEAFGLVFLEAGLMHKAAIGARNTGAEGIILHGKTGLLFENGDVASLANAMKQLISNASERQEFGDQGYMRVSETLLPSRVIHQYTETYRSVS